MISAKISKPESGAGTSKSPEIETKRDFAARWQVSLRTVCNLQSKGLPHLSVGKRRVRIIPEAADRWMVENFGVQRIGKVGGAR